MDLTALTGNIKEIIAACVAAIGAYVLYDKNKAKHKTDKTAITLDQIDITERVQDLLKKQIIQTEEFSLEIQKLKQLIRNQAEEIAEIRFLERQCQEERKLEAEQLSKRMGELEHRYRLANDQIRFMHDLIESRQQEKYAKESNGPDK